MEMACKGRIPLSMLIALALPLYLLNSINTAILSFLFLFFMMERK